MLLCHGKKMRTVLCMCRYSAGAMKQTQLDDVGDMFSITKLLDCSLQGFGSATCNHSEKASINISVEEDRQQTVLCYWSGISAKFQAVYMTYTPCK